MRKMCGEMSKENYSVTNKYKKQKEVRRGIGIKQTFYRLYMDILSVKWAVIFIIAYFICSRAMWGSICPSVLLTGYPCPACGLTRAGRLLLQFDFSGAWQVHPFIYPTALWILAAAIFRYILGKRLPGWLKWFGGILIAAAILFFALRMYREFPGEPPMSYYYDNLLAWVRRTFAGGF